MRRTCQADQCSKLIADSKRSDAKYCSVRCSNRMVSRRHRDRKRQAESPGKDRRSDGLTLVDSGVEFKEKHESVDGRGSARRGPDYERFVRSGLAEEVRGGMGSTEAAELFSEVIGRDVSSQAVSRWKAAYLEDYDTGEVLKDWSRKDTINESMADFEAFCKRYWPKDDIPWFHQEWADLISSLDDGDGHGGKVMLLAPQRHGKSMLLIKYVIWRICGNPNIRILWVGKTQGLAEKPVGYIRQVLSENTGLIEDIFGPGFSLQPSHRSGLPWTNGELTVSARTELLVSPTLVALGIGGSVLGRDADLIIIDDPIDRRTSSSPTTRDKDMDWFFTDFLSRKMEHTGVAYIGSRQHVMDLPSEILKRDGWDVRIYRSHEPTCMVPEWDLADHTACVLWPKVRSFKWLMQQKAENEDHFERNYQNNPTGDTYDRPSKSDIERAWDERTYGVASDATRLLASVDPGSGVKKHAIVVWAYSEDGVREVVDVLRPIAGTPGMVAGVREVYERYKVTNWIFEKNRYEDQLRNDAGLQELRDSLGLNYRLHYTSGVNKQSPTEGVTAMLVQFRRDPAPIRLAGGNQESRLRLMPLVREVMSYDPDFSKSSKHADDDLVMAMWVGWYWMQKHVGQSASEMDVSYPPGFRGKDLAFMGWQHAPWEAA